MAVNTQVAFKFDQAMKTNTAIAGTPPNIPGAVTWPGTGIDVAKFSYSWSSDGKTLFCNYTGNFPQNTQVNWLLNPSAAPVKLESQAGPALPADTYSGQFKTGSSVPDCNPDGVPSTWGVYGISKASNFEQTSAADPLPQNSETAFVFSALVSSPQAGPVVTAGSVTLPDGSVSNLTVFANFGQFFATPATEAALNAAFPGGNYVLRFTQSGQAERAINMTMPAAMPPVPKIANFDEAQAVNAGADFVLRWNAFTGSGANSHLSIVISDDQGNSLFQAPDPCVPRDLPVTATWVVITANTLQSNQTYSATLVFGQIFYSSTNTVPEMSGFGDISRSTQFSIKTGQGGSGTVVAATLSEFGLALNGNPQFHLAGTTGHTYAIQRTGSLTNPNWQQVGSETMDSLGSAVFEDTQTGKVFPLFYRAVAN